MREIEFDIKVGRKDLYDFLMRHFYTSFSGIFGIILSLGAFGWFFVELKNGDLMKLGLLLMMASLFTIIQPLQMKLKAAKQISSNPFFKEALHYRINEKGMTVSQNLEATTVEWNSIRKVVETKRAFYVYMTVMNANVIPKNQLAIEQVEVLQGLVKESAGRR